ncbi:site-specific integrase [Nibribacter ruber]|uniref:site-specific integrase n=1 Tax=Nibribacter ruber TaxID=2698458 RepID=UPI001E4DBDF7|nr:site-specific integrase [Nibribacter ruber]
MTEYFGETYPIKELTVKECEGFREYLITAKSQRNESKISTNTAVSYYGNFRATLKLAYQEGHLLQDLDKRAGSIKPEETERQFLTLEELQALVNTPCPNDLLRKAALFSALTGLRYSDIEKLTWEEIHHSEATGYSLRFRQKKTKGSETFPISEQAVLLLGERKTGKVLEGLTYSNTLLEQLRTWVNEAKIAKYVTFHSFRHTYAILQISSGTGFFTLSKMMGHRDLKTTQVYAKVMDKAKQDAANKIKLVL